MRARFYCAYCRTEVGPRAAKCPKCGKYFSAVACPSCGFKGDSAAFENGCPVCGYLVQQRDDGTDGSGGAVGGPASQRKQGLSSSFYAAAAIVLGAVVIVLIVVLLWLNT